jgi:hypothetical protein
MFLSFSHNCSPSELDGISDLENHLDKLNKISVDISDPEDRIPIEKLYCVSILNWKLDRIFGKPDRTTYGGHPDTG